MPLKEVGLEEILEAQSRQQAEKEEQDRLRSKIFKERGLTYTSESIMDDAYWIIFLSYNQEWNTFLEKKLGSLNIWGLLIILYFSVHF